MPDLFVLETGQVMDIITEAGNDKCDYQEIATQEDMDRL